MTVSPRPLHGVTVVSVEQAVAAPFATRQLADLGARVIKIERPGDGDFCRRYDRTVTGESSYFVWLNRSKESVTLDIRSEAGRGILGALLSDADVLVTNLGPGAARRSGLAADQVEADHPDLIVCTMTGYGGTGPWSDRKAYDMLVQAEAGLLSVTGTPEVPCRAGISVADIAAGMYAYSGILTALYRRDVSGVRSHVEVSLFESLAEWMSQPMNYAAGSGTCPPRAGGEHATIAPYGPYPTADGRTVFLAIQNEREWSALCSEVLGDAAVADDPRFADNPGRVANRVALNERISARTAELTLHEAVERLGRAGIANAQLRDMFDLAAHPSLAGRNRWMNVATPGGGFRALRPPADLSGVEPRADPVPGIGEHTDAVLAEFGVDTGRLAELRRDRTI